MYPIFRTVKKLITVFGVSIATLDVGTYNQVMFLSTTLEEVKEFYGRQRQKDMVTHKMKVNCRA